MKGGEKEKVEKQDKKESESRKNGLHTIYCLHFTISLRFSAPSSLFYYVVLYVVTIPLSVALFPTRSPKHKNLQADVQC